MKLAIITAHAGADSLEEAIQSWAKIGDWNGESDIYCDPPILIIDGQTGILPAYQRGLEKANGNEFDILAFLHDDLIIHDKDWVARVLKEFADPEVGLVGFGGALRHGSPELYKTPYDYHQLGRDKFLSNMDDAEAHGARFSGVCDVSVLDGFSLIFRRDVLRRAGGWPVDALGYVGYDYWASCMCHRLHYRIRLVGVRCRHLGGRTFVKLGLGQGPEHWEQFLKAHEYIYNEFKDVLPYSVF